MPDIKDKPKANGKIKEKVRTAPKELVRHGLSSGTDRLREQFRDNDRQDQREDMGQTQLEDGVYQGTQYAAQGGQRMLQKAKQSIIQSRSGGKTSSDSRSVPTSSTATASAPTADKPRTIPGAAPITEEMPPRIKTREAYCGRQAASAQVSEGPFQGGQLSAYRQGREHAAKKAVLERRNYGMGSPVRQSGSEHRAAHETVTTKGQVTARSSAGRSASAALGRGVGRDTRQTVGRGVRQAVKGKESAMSASKATVRSAQAATRKAYAMRRLTSNAVKYRWTARTAGRDIGAAAQAVSRTVRAIAAAARELLAALAAGGSVCVIIVVVLCLIGVLAASPVGILFAGESGTDSVPASAAVAQVNYDLNAQLESLQSGTYDEIEIVGQPPDWEDVLAVFAVYVAGGDDPVDVAVMDADRIARLKAVFWDMTSLESAVNTTDHPDNDPSDAVDDSYSETVLTITISDKTVEEMAAVYGFTQEQQDMLDELLLQREMLTELTGETENIGTEAREVLHSLPAALSPERRDVVRHACSLVGKVGYFWGGKALVLGWDSRWGTLQKVTADGSPTTGTYRLYGLDCSGMVDWVFYNASGGDYTIGHGGGASAQHSYCTDIGWDEAQPGDLVFYPGDEHVGIVGGWDEDGNLLVIHCASGFNNVVITGADGFTSIARPNYYPE